jgi:hypothetical protein
LPAKLRRQYGHGEHEAPGKLAPGIWLGADHEGLVGFFSDGL